MNEQTIWNFLYERLGNPCGVAGLMGNLYVESRLDPCLLESSFAKRHGLTSKQYVKGVDNGTYDNFVHDSAGFGLAQWTYWSRKEALLSFASGRSIGDLNMQLKFLWTELQSYKTVINTLKSAKSVKEASDVVVERYEKPRTINEKTKQIRAEHAQMYFDSFANQKPDSAKKVLVSSEKVNIRCGNGLNYGRIGQVPKDAVLSWIATAENGWHAVEYKNQVGWISGNFSKIIE